MIKQTVRTVKGLSKDREKYMTEDELRTGIQRRISPLKEVTDADVMEQIDRMLLEDPDALRMSVRERLMLRKRLFDSLRRLDILQQLIEDESVTEIMVNGPGTIFVERSGRLERWDKSFTGKERLSDVIQQIVSRVNRAVNTASPIVDARLEDGSRVNVVLPPVAPDGPILTIRRFPKDPLVMQGLIRRNSISADAAWFLKILVRCGYNLFISGGTGSGKTTFLNALSAFIPEHERIITIEDSLELQIQNIPNLVRLETRNRNAEGMGEITIRDLIRTALRMRPDRIIVGEVRGAEALDMLQAFNTGHDGSLSTAHANSPEDLLSRLETMVLMAGELPLAAIRGQIVSSIDILVHLARLHDGSRKVMEIREVGEFQDGRILTYPLFQWSEEKNRLVRTGQCLRRKGKLIRNGSSEDRERLQELFADTG